jgi:GDPmannose 4,6-dehydratase
MGTGTGGIARWLVWEAGRIHDGAFMTKALILGVNGQDGSYLAEFLLGKGYQVVGWIPAGIPLSLDTIQPILEKITLIEGDLLEQNSLNTCIGDHRPDEIYNLASPSSPSASWNAAVQVGEIVALGVVRLLEAIRSAHPQARLFQASSSELFGDQTESPQRETTPFYPRNPYGMAKAYAHWAVANYRRQYGLFAVSGIMFNHESPRRTVEFITRKITYGLAGIKSGKMNELSLGNVEARRDWGFAPDYVAAMWKMLQCQVADDFVVGTGETHSVEEFLDEAFRYLNMDWHEYVKIDPKLYRANDGAFLQADPGKARKVLNWEPRIFFKELVRIMVDADLELVGQESPGEGIRVIEKYHEKWHHWNSQAANKG